MQNDAKEGRIEAFLSTLTNSTLTNLKCSGCSCDKQRSLARSEVAVDAGFTAT